MESIITLDRVFNIDLKQVNEIKNRATASNGRIKYKQSGEPAQQVFPVGTPVIRLGLDISASCVYHRVRQKIT